MARPLNSCLASCGSTKTRAPQRRKVSSRNETNWRGLAGASLPEAVVEVVYIEVSDAALAQGMLSIECNELSS